VRERAVAAGLGILQPAPARARGSEGAAGEGATLEETPAPVEVSQAARPAQEVNQIKKNKS